MRHVFIINPAAGKHQNACQIVPDIEAVFAAHPEYGEHEIIYTKKRGHATLIAREHAERGDAVRLYAAGGDGTLAEVLQGMYAFENAQLTCMPYGSGNDYLRMFRGRDFTNIEALVTGEEMRVDLIDCGGAISLNIACMGMDADVASKMVRYKHLPLVSGSMAYNLAIADVFFHRIGKELTVTMDTLQGEVKRSGRYFFALAASGEYYGGGYHGAPMARPDDGILDFVLVKAMSRAKILKFLPDYKSGNFLDCPYVEVFRGTKMRVECDEGAVVALDGECSTHNDITFEIKKQALTFILPRRATVKTPIKADMPLPKKAVPNT